MKSVIFFSFLLSLSAFADETPPPAPPSLCSADGKDISADSPAILTAIKGSEFCSQGVRLVDACSSGERIDVSFVAAAAPRCQAEFEANRPTESDKALLQSMRSACEAKWKNLEGTQYESMNSNCKLKAWLWMVNLTSENGRH